MESLLSQFAAYNIDEQTLLLGVILIATILIVFTLSLLFIGSKSPVRAKFGANEKRERSKQIEEKVASLIIRLNHLLP